MSNQACALSEKKYPRDTAISRFTKYVQQPLLNISYYIQITLQALHFSLNIVFLEPLQHTFRKGYDEPIKIAILHDRIAALLRALVHAFPLSIAIWEIILSLNTYYLGSSTYSQIYYQFGAKVHELTIQISVTTIVFAYIRRQLLDKEGLPFGAVLSGFQINQINYLWSMELWGLLRSQDFSKRRRVLTLSFIILGIFLAASAGPSSAVLLIPHLDYSPAGTTHIWMNGSFDDIWPIKLDGALIPSICAFSSNALTSTQGPSGCPSAQWQSIRNWISLDEDSLPVLLSRKLNAEISPYAIQVADDRQDLRYVVSTTQQAAVADSLVNTAALWEQATLKTRSRKYSGAPVSDQQDALHTIKTGYYQPYSIAFCAFDTIQGPNDQRPLAFPINPAIDYTQVPLDLEFINTTIAGVPAIEYQSLTRAALHDLPGLRSQNRVKWVDLSGAPFNRTSIGAIIVLSRIPSDGTLEEPSQKLVICTISAGWGLSSISTNSFRSTISATSSVVVTDNTVSSKDFKLLQSQLSQTASPGNFFEQFTNPSIYYRLPWYPTLPIKVNKEWAEYLNPFIPELNTTVIDTLLTAAALNHSRSAHPEATAQVILSGLMTNGLAMQGCNSQIQGSYKTTVGPNNTTELDGNSWLSGKNDFFTVDPNESKDWLKLRVDSTIKGYVYNSQGVSVKIALAVLVLYCAMAISHCIYSGIFGISSSSWNTISEFMALAINSQPTPLLRNTCAGIVKLYIFKTRVRILAKNDEEGDGEHLELVFGNVSEQDIERGIVKLNRKYGTMPLANKKHRKLL